MLKGKEIYKFIRFGTLDLKNQKGFGSDTYHSPPASRGFYAMPYILQCRFLIGSIDEYQPGTTPKFRPEENYDEWDKRYKKAVSKMKKIFVRKKGNIWHHLEEYADQAEIIARNGAWVKTSIAHWAKCVSKSSLNDRYGEKYISDIKSINETKGISGYYSKDHYEVFFDEK